MEVPEFTEDLVVFGRFEHLFKIPGQRKTHNVLLGILLSSELDEVYEATTRFSSDEVYRSRLIQKETLVRAILDIDGISFRSDDSKRFLRSNILDLMTESALNNLYSYYNAMVVSQDRFLVASMASRDIQIDYPGLIESLKQVSPFIDSELEELMERLGIPSVDSDNESKVTVDSELEE